MRVQNQDLGPFYLFCYSTAAWLGLQSAVLIVTPKVVTSLLAADEMHHTSDLEIYLGRSLGFALLALALGSLFFTGTIPISTTASEPISLEENNAQAPYANSVLYVMNLFESLSTVYCYTRYANTGQSGFLIGTIGYGGLMLFGAWCQVFGFSSRISARTGQDKRTSDFLFPNKSAYDKKADRKGQ